MTATRLARAFIKSVQLNEVIGSGEVPGVGYVRTAFSSRQNQGKTTAATVVVFNNFDLPTNEYLKYSKTELNRIGITNTSEDDEDANNSRNNFRTYVLHHPIKAMWYSLPSFKKYSTAELMGGLFVAPIINRLQITLFTALEFFARGGSCIRMA